MFLSKLLISSFIMSGLNKLLTVALLTWATGVIRSQSLICPERSEQIAHSHLGDLSKCANERWANERIPSPESKREKPSSFQKTFGGRRVENATNPRAHVFSFLKLRNLLKPPCFITEKRLNTQGMQTQKLQKGHKGIFSNSYQDSQSKPLWLSDLFSLSQTSMFGLGTWAPVYSGTFWSSSLVLYLVHM